MLERARSHYLDGVPTEIIPVTTPLPEMMSKAVDDFPQNVAIDFLGKEYTYLEIYKEIKRATNVLKANGITKGDVVSVALPNCPQHYIAFFAISYLGATVSEHNPLAPPQQLKEQFANVKPKVFIAWDKTLEKMEKENTLESIIYFSVDLTKALTKKNQFLLKLPIKKAKEKRNAMTGKAPKIALSWDAEIAKTKPLNFSKLPKIDLDDTAVLIQTGGTTGTPKAVMLSHRNIMSNARQIEYWLRDFERGNETVGAVLPFFHAFGLQLSLSVCLNTAATQIMLPTFDVDLLLAAHRRHPLTFFGGVPAMFDRIMKAAEKSGDDLSTIRYSVSGAMSLSADIAHRWEKVTGGWLSEGYGMTETSPVISGSPLANNRRISTLGVPFPSTEVRIVNPDNPDQDLAEGEIGEILVRGPQVFQGYLNNPEETALVFHKGWLRTGDLGKWDDGFMVMADRSKELIINGGFNVYPSEVESVIKKLDGVADVAVVGMPTDEIGETVVAAIVPEPGAKIDLETVRKWTENKLSRYAMPKSIAILDNLPRSPIGKVMRRSVKEQLQNFELRSGTWKQKIVDMSNTASKTFDSYLETLKQKTNASAEQWHEWYEHNKIQYERLTSWVAENTPSTEELATKAEELGVSAKHFASWVNQVNPMVKKDTPINQDELVEQDKDKAVDSEDTDKSI